MRRSTKPKANAIDAAVVASRFFAALAFSISFLAAACGGATATGPADSGPGGEDAGLGDAQNDSGESTPCNGGPVTFRMSAAMGGHSSYCIGEGCGLAWLSITSERNENISYGPGCMLLCVDCRSGGCTLECRTPQPLHAEGEQLIWDGRVWVSSTCGARSSCTTPTCATPGKYIAQMCARANTSVDAGASCPTAPTAPPTCVEVEFEYPAAAVVEGVLP